MSRSLGFALRAASSLGIALRGSPARRYARPNQELICGLGGRLTVRPLELLDRFGQSAQRKQVEPQQAPRVGDIGLQLERDAERLDSLGVLTLLVAHQAQVEVDLGDPGGEFDRRLQLTGGVVKPVLLAGLDTRADIGRRLRVDRLGRGNRVGAEDQQQQKARGNGMPCRRIGRLTPRAHYGSFTATI